MDKASGLKHMPQVGTIKKCLYLKLQYADYQCSDQGRGVQKRQAGAEWRYMETRSVIFRRTQGENCWSAGATGTERTGMRSS